MTMDLFLGVLVVLMAFAVLSLLVGVANDAVNFLAPAVGSRATSARTALLVASLGILVGVTLSGGMMEVARKGIFHPQYFNMPEIMFILLAVMMADVLLLDLFNTFGIPTSTTVSLIFDLMGAAAAVAMLKIFQVGGDFTTIGQYINLSKITVIIVSIFLSIILAFTFGALIQFITRIIFTFDYEKNLARFGALWCGIAVTFIGYFIVIKGIKGASFLTPEMGQHLQTHLTPLIALFFLGSLILFQLLLLFKINVLKVVVLVGTFALALAFAANDLVNFIGVPLTGLTTHQMAKSMSAPLTTPMAILQHNSIHYPSWILLLAGAIMLSSLWFSKKSRTVTQTSLDLARQSEGLERYEPTMLSRFVVRMAVLIFRILNLLIPAKIKSWVNTRTDPVPKMQNESAASFDLIRASVNLMVASALISIGTSLKLPLSTTYVTFMVAMGSSFADRAWGKDSAVYRVTGVFAVMASWLLTGFFAFTISFIFAVVLMKFEILGASALLVLVAISFYRTRIIHNQGEKDRRESKIFNLKKVHDRNTAIEVTFEHTAIFLEEIRRSLIISVDALFAEETKVLAQERKNSKKIQSWATIITANIFKSLRLIQAENEPVPLSYGKVVACLQRISDDHRNMVLRSYLHVANNHTGPLPEQKCELLALVAQLTEMMQETADMLKSQTTPSIESVQQRDQQIQRTVQELNEKQLTRIVGRQSKTRLSILYYATLGDVVALSKQNLRLVEIFHQCFNSKN